MMKKYSKMTHRCRKQTAHKCHTLATICVIIFFNTQIHAINYEILSGKEYALTVERKFIEIKVKTKTPCALSVSWQTSSNDWRKLTRNFDALLPEETMKFEFSENDLSSMNKIEMPIKITCHEQDKDPATQDSVFDATLKIDIMPPITHVYPKPGRYTESAEIEVTFSCADNVGCKTIHMTDAKAQEIDPGNDRTKIIRKLPAGYHKFSVKSIDNAGNEEKEQQIIFVVGDNEAPIEPDKKKQTASSFQLWDFSGGLGLTLGSFNSTFSRVYGLQTELHMLYPTDNSRSRFSSWGFTLSGAGWHYSGHVRNVYAREAGGQVGGGLMWIFPIWPENKGYLTINPLIGLAIMNIGGDTGYASTFANGYLSMTVGYRFFFDAVNIFGQTRYTTYLSYSSLQSLIFEGGVSIVYGR